MCQLMCSIVKINKGAHKYLPWAHVVCLACRGHMYIGTCFLTNAHRAGASSSTVLCICSRSLLMIFSIAKISSFTSPVSRPHLPFCWSQFSFNQQLPLLSFLTLSTAPLYSLAEHAKRSGAFITCIISSHITCFLGHCIALPIFCGCLWAFVIKAHSFSSLTSCQHLSSSERCIFEIGHQRC